MGESYAQMEKSFPSFKKVIVNPNNDDNSSSNLKELEYIIIAKVKDTNYLVVQADTISDFTSLDNKNNTTIYKIVDISEMDLTDTENPIRN